MTGRTTSKSAPPAAAEPRWLDAREQAAWRGLLAMHGQLTARIAADLKHDSDLSDADYAVLVGVSEAAGERVRPSELGAALGWEKSRLSKQISRMEERGLLDRETCPTDARGSFAVLTDLGRATIVAAAPRHAARVRAAFLDALTDEQLEQLTEIARAVVGHLDARR